MEYTSLEAFLTAIQSDEVNKDEVTFHFDGMTFYAMSKDLETEYISGEWEEVYVFLKSHLSTLGLKIVEESTEPIPPPSPQIDEKLIKKAHWI